MKTIALVLASFCLVSAAMADDSCAVQATGKKLAGAALSSFAKKCCKDQAAAQKLHGAAADQLHQEVPRRRRREVRLGVIPGPARSEEPGIDNHVRAVSARRRYSCETGAMDSGLALWAPRNDRTGAR